MLQVCTVKPGKLLQLSTAIGMARMNTIVCESSNHTEIRQTKGKLKSGRLYIYNTVRQYGLCIL